MTTKEHAVKTVTLKISSSGFFTLANPAEKPDQDNLIYKIKNVPDDLMPRDVAMQANKICFLHPQNDPEARIYEWAELEGKKQGAIINRYPKS